MFLVLAIVAAWATGTPIDVSRELAAQSARWGRMEALFVSSDPTGTLRSFVPSESVSLVLDESPLAADAIGALTGYAQLELRTMCRGALLREFMRVWTDVRDELDSEARPMRVPNLECIQIVQKWEQYARSFVHMSDTLEYDPKSMDFAVAMGKTQILNILRPFIQFPHRAKSMEEADARVGQLVLAALQSTRYIGTPVLRMLEDVENTLAKNTEVFLPDRLAKQIESVDAIIRMLEKNAVNARHANPFPKM